MYQQGMNHDKGAQDWQLEAREHNIRHNFVARHRNIINEMDNQPTTWGVNISKRK